MSCSCQVHVILKGKGEAAKAVVSRSRTTPVWKGDGNYT